MNSKTLRAKYLKFAILIISICFILGAISACLPFNISIPTLDNDTINNTAMTITQNSTDGLGEFNDGYTYVYTDKTKIDNFRAGLIDYDITLHSVAKTTTNRGSQDNPYVLSSVADWDTFVKLMETDSTHGSGKYYVLASSLDFTGEIFHPVRFFSGSFYGMGNTISNIDCSTWQYYNGGTVLTDIASTTLSFGLFCRLTNATITDLVVEDFIYSQIPVTSHFPGSTDRLSATGGIAGMSSGNDAVLNCHTSGEITSTISYTSMLPTGGIIGTKFTFGTANTTTMFYRCSSNIEITIIGSGSISYSGATYGGIFGENYNNNNSSTTYMYDCVANTIANNNAPNQVYSGAFGYKYFSLYMENVVCALDLNYGYIGGAIFGLNSAGLSGTAYFKNVYSEGNIGVGASKSSMLAIVSNSSSVRFATSPNIANLNVVKNGAYATPYDTDGDALANNTEPTEYPNSSAMVAEAKTFFGATPHPNIWDVDKIGGDYTPDNSPVRNYLLAFVNFRNLTNSGNSEEKVGLDDGVGYKVGDKLPDETSSVSAFTTYLNNKANTNHEFLGWTDDPTGESEPFTELPSGLFGDVTLYAVWGLSDSYVNSNIKTSLSADKTLIEYDSVASITLTAKVTHTSPSSGAMTNPSATYSFMQDGEEKTTSANVKNSGVLSVKTVKDSGKYTFKYRLTDGLEPLWFYDGNSASSEEKTITIEKGKLEHMTIKDFKISSSTVPYYGKELKDVDFSVKMYNNANKAVELATETPYKWQIEIDRVTPGTNDDKKIVIYPADTDNYETSYEFLVEFEAQALVIVFHMEQISKEIEVEVEYGQNYGANEIIYLFEQAYLKALSTWDSATIRVVESKAPYLDGKALVEGDANANKFDTEYNGINEIHTIEVTFKDASYEVVFNPNNGGASNPTQETYKYGQFLKKPTDPVNGDLLFVGWYFDEDYIDENGNQATRNRAWRFNSVGDIPQDRVTKAVTLIAKWLKADTLDSIKVEVDPSKKYMAQTSLQEGDLIVTATYSGQVDGQSIEQEVVLSWSDFASGITYSTIDKQLHVTDGGYEVTVSFTYGSTTKSDSILINVLPISVDTSKAKFEDKVVIYDGTDKDERIGEVTWSGARPSQITGVTYIYTLDGAIVEESSLKGLGDYIVQAVFTMRSKDFYADPLIATLSIRSPTALEKPTFKGGVTYDGTEKNIEDYLDGYNSEYMQIVGDVTGTVVGRYTITIQLTDGSWADGTAGNVTLNWTIDKATLIPKWDNWEFVSSDTSNGFAPVISSIAQGLASGDSVDYATDFIYKIYDEEGNELSESEVSEVGSYKIVASINASSALYKNYQFDGASNEWSFVVVPQAGMEILTIEWSNTEFLHDGEKHIPTYVVKDRDGNVVENATQILNFSNYEKKTEIATYTIKVTVKDSDRYFIRSGAICKFKIVEELGDEPPAEDEDPTTPPSGNGGNGSGSLDELLGQFKEFLHWQLIVSPICILLIVIFAGKGASYLSKSKQNRKMAESRYKTYYSWTALGLVSTSWTVIASVLIALAVLSFVFMLIAKSKFNKSLIYAEGLREEYERNKEEIAERKREEEARKRDESMQMMLMSMMGGNAGNGQSGSQGAYVGGGYGLGAEEIRGIVSDTMTAMLPGVQQMLPQQASVNNELVEKLLEKSEKSEEAMLKMMEKSQKNEEEMRDLLKKLTEQPAERVVEREVASSVANDEALKQMMKTQENLMHNQEKLMEKILEMSTNQSQPQIVEKVVEVPVEVEKVVEKEVVKEVPVEKIVEVPVEVEKIVEKEVVKEVKVEVPAKAVAKPKKEIAPRLTLDEAYALLTKEQKKYFDGLREYALTKYKCKEKKSTYFVVYGQTTTNPLLKLTVKKDTTVALLKMEDEYMKDLRRDATGDGTKVKVKETEVLVSDAQAYETAKKMVDLRYDQIERYQDLLREQRAMKK